ncbi:MAG: hypothetical protein AAF729_10500 [Pseudomonadota bacterium]
MAHKNLEDMAEVMLMHLDQIGVNLRQTVEQDDWTSGVIEMEAKLVQAGSSLCVSGRVIVRGSTAVR